MANILLLDENEVAGRAMQGILARAHHACFVVTKPEEAWRVLREGVVIDLIIVELKLTGSSGIAFIQRLRDDCFWKILPVVVYTYEADVRQVKKALALNVQNYLIKPYNEDQVYAEIAKATRNPWRNLHFEEPKSFCALLGITQEALVTMRRAVMMAYDAAAREFPKWAVRRENTEVFARLGALASDAEGAGVWAGVDFVRELQNQATLANWDVFQNCGEPLDYASRLIFCQLNPSFTPDCLRSSAEIDAAKEAAERLRWERADVDASGPLVEAAVLEKQVAALPGCPVVDTTAAAFQMAADGRAASMSLVLDLVSTDPGLCAQVISAANHAAHDEMTPIEDAAAAATLLGELKLNALAKALPTVAERQMHLPPLTWANYWRFQVGVGRVAQFVCGYLELSYLKGTAYTAGLLHDIGKLLLLRLHPHGFTAIARHATDRKLSLRAAEKKYLGCTTRDLAVHFAESHRFPAVYVDVLRWVETPEQATAHADLVAMVAMARHICLHNHVGYCGDTPRDCAPPIGSTAAWRVLQPQLFPSFDLRKFETHAHDFCVTLRQDLSGQRRADALVA